MTGNVCPPHYRFSFHKWNLTYCKKKLFWYLKYFSPVIVQIFNYSSSAPIINLMYGVIQNSNYTKVDLKNLAELEKITNDEVRLIL